MISVKNDGVKENCFHGNGGHLGFDGTRQRRFNFYGEGATRKIVLLIFQPVYCDQCEKFWRKK